MMMQIRFLLWIHYHWHGADPESGITVNLRSNSPWMEYLLFLILYTDLQELQIILSCIILLFLLQGESVKLWS